MGKTVRDVLDELRSNSHDEVEKGRKFEHLMLAFLRNDLQYSKLFDKVWLWADYPNRGNRPDTGIDLVARERATGDLVAIQCKFYAPDTVISKPAVDSFLATSSKAEFGGRLLITTSDHWGKNAKDALLHQTPPVSIMSVADLDESSIDWSTFSLEDLGSISAEPIKQPRPHQESAISDCLKGFKESDRGRLIMACGTGKTFTSLRLTERLLPKGGFVLFLVPSISLLSQAVKEWSINAESDITSFAVCSDVSAGRRKNDEDLPVTDLAFPATTDAKSFIQKFEDSKAKAGRLQVVFSTYQSIAVVAEAQSMGLPAFDLVICDEAHRTTGVTASGEESTTFMKVHDEEFISSEKRLYMTATPKVFSDATTRKAEEADAVIADMNNESIYGPEFHRLGFGEAVERDILTDYKVVVLAVDEQYVAEKFQRELAAEDNQLNLEDTAKIVGCWNGLSKRALKPDDFNSDPQPMKRAVAFARSIAESKTIATMFQQVVDKEMSQDPDGLGLRCEVQHVDGTFSSFDRNEKLDWLKQEPAEGTARILSNARCLTEGVDVPALDAIMFLKPRDSQIDVVQAVGRVMRKLEGKKYGYVILPIAVPAGVDPETALSDNKKYRVVWQVLQALRSHDERFDAMVNRIDLTGKSPQIEILGVGGESPDESVSWGQTTLQFPNFDAWKDAILAKIVEKVGERRYWEKWAGDVADIARRHILLINTAIDSGDAEIRGQFETFLQGLRDNLNPGVTKQDAVEMLSQHVITAPVFSALFGTYEFVSKNPVSKVMQKMVEALEGAKFDSEVEKLAPFYDSVAKRAAGITTSNGRQSIIKQLYEEFFRNAFPDASSRLGIVYTPIEVVDFMIRSTEVLMKNEFGRGLGEPGVKVLDPFTGTGTFVARLVESGAIEPKDLKAKFAEDIHANELVLLAYYIAAINVEETLNAITGEYIPFSGLVLTDTFQMSESKDGLDGIGVFEDNNERVIRQQNQNIQAIIGNPPYSSGLTDANTNSQEVRYEDLERRILETYSSASSSKSRASLYNSYIKAFRWASDRIGENGIISFVSNGAWLDSKSADGVRQSFANEFSKIFVINLKGNANTLGEQRKKQGGNIFGSGSKSPVAITFLIRNSKMKGPVKAEVYEMDDYLTQEQKLQVLQEAGSLEELEFTAVNDPANSDWINLRNEKFEKYTLLFDNEYPEKGVFEAYSNGLKSNRDAWVYNWSRRALEESMKSSINFYNAALKNQVTDIDDSTKISWDAKLRNRFSSGRQAKFDQSAITTGLYRPFTKMNLYFDKDWNNSQGKLPQMWSDGIEQKFLVIAAPADTWSPGALVTNVIPDKNVNGMFCFPLHRVDGGNKEASLFDDEAGWAVNEAFTKSVSQMIGKEVSPEQVFGYVFFVLNHPSYQSTFGANLKKEMPRIPISPDFVKFASIGVTLVELFAGYDKLDAYPLTFDNPNKPKVQKLRLIRGTDKTVRVRVNESFDITGFPNEIDDFKVFGRSPLAWVADRYGISTNTESGIVNDANEWGLENGNPHYIYDLIGQVTNLTLKTQEAYASAGEVDWEAI
jgi:predicted helicase